MKNLKRVLSLALATVMVIGMMVVGANAAFSDQSSIKYDDAVNTLVGLGVINGMGDNTFAPNGTVTRAQAAKMVAYVKAGANTTTVGYYDGTTKFTDVGTNYSWASGSINYCVSNGIVSGRTATTFDPSANVTGAELAKMLLVALGYPEQSERETETLVGAKWQLNAIRLATENNLFDGLDNAFVATKAATRQEAAQIVCNALFQPTWKIVSYSNNTPVYSKVDGHGSANANLLASAFKATENTNQYDGYGRPATTYTAQSDGTVLATLTQKPILTYTTTVTVGKLLTDIANAGYKVADGATTIARAVNGNTSTQSIATATDEIGGNGIKVEIFANATTKVVSKVVVIKSVMTNAAAYTVDNANTTAVDERTVTLAQKDSAGNGLVLTPKNTANFDAIYNSVVSNGAAATKVLVTPKATDANDSAYTGVVLDASLLTAKTVTLNSFNTTAGYFVADGQTYNFAKVAAAADKSAVANANLGKALTIYTDSYGYVLTAAAASTTASTNYAMIMDYDAATMAGQQVKILKADGTYAVVNAKVGTVANNAQLTDSNITKASTLVSYTEVDGVYYLTVLGNADATTVGKQAVSTIAKGNANLGGNKYADSTTVFVLVDAKGVVTTYTGISNVPTLSGGTKSGIGKGNNVSYVFVTGAQLQTASAKDLIYVFDKVATVSGTAEKPLYTYNVLKNGAIATVTFSTDVSTNIDGAGVYEITTYDANGYATAVTDATAPNDFTLTGNGTEVTSFANGTLIAGSAYTVNDSTKFVKVDATTKAMTIVTAADITVKVDAAGISGSKVIVTTALNAAGTSNATGIAALVFIVG